MSTKVKPYTTRIRAALASRGLEQHKEEMVLTYTDGRTKHISQMHNIEAEALLHYINNLNKSKAPSPQQANAGSRENIMRRKVLAICHTLGWYKRTEGDKLVLVNGKPQLDFNRIDKFCLERSHAKKTLQAHTAQELPLLITSFERLLKHDLK